MFKVKVSGFGDVKAQFLSASKDVSEVVDQEIESMAKEWVAGAKRDAPGDQGTLRNSISYLKTDTGVEIVSNVFYSPFMEFGTKGKYQAIPGTEAIAAQFKGFKGGDFAQMLKFIKAWVKRKGIGAEVTKSGNPSKSQNSLASQDRVAWVIAMSILKNGIKPHPFFFKQQEVVWPEMVRRVKARIESGQKVSVIMPGEVLRPRIITI